MKFWVKAIMDDNVQEQLLVSANNSEELVWELGNLLHAPVTWMSVSDFQTQVVDKLNSGADIVTVKLTTLKAATQPQDIDSSFTPPEGRTQRATPAQPGLAQALCREEEEWVPLSRSPSQSESGTHVRPAVLSRLMFDMSHIDRICLRRDDVELLLHPTHNGAYHSVVSGCFVRIRERQDYSLYQIVRPVSSVELVLDMIHYEETRRTEVVSNALPVLPEVNAWGRKMVAASRNFVTAGFVEAKVGDVDSSLRSARAATATASPEPLFAQCLTGPPPTPPANGKDFCGRRCRATVLSLPRTFLHASPGRVPLKTNDALLHAQVCVVEEPEKDDYNIVLFASRLSNGGKKKPRLSDFAGCMITMGKGRNSGIVSDRDVTEKGYEIFCAPQRWGCNYVTLAQIRPSVGDAPYFDEAGNQLQDFTVLWGRFVTGLFNPPTIATLPIPAWAQADGVSAFVVRPHLVAHREQLHVFYLIRMVGVNPSRHSSFSRGNAGDVCDASLGTGSIAGNTSCDRTNSNGPMAAPGGASRSGSPHSSVAAGGCRYGLAHAVATDDKLRTWQLVSEKNPLFSCANTAPVFTAASTCQTEAVREGDGAGVVSSSPPEKVLQVLWHEEEHSVQRPALSFRRSPGSSVSLNTSMSVRAPLPFERWVNAHQDVLPDLWVQEPSFSAVRVDSDALRLGVASLSLYEHDGVLFAACVQMDSRQKSTVATVPVTAEP
ncbi:hypothetical protein DQ04_07201030 [Trypanosoma grayi]|uniref:hypothetical protein n=1 Tax=Trypanosoma grayi TaxID=71804 RepID=UPI0004F40528|nr:hypothetical protein DQ04_07201030 [Trypanosoma grayi]KEG08432.1 hypothetical protein DQ04_07201030 [Trypanosoma grayi]